MKLRPIIFKPLMVWAILNGFKTETRQLKNRFKMEAGDRFWVREPWTQYLNADEEYDYEADFYIKNIGFVNNDLITWKNPQYMPKAASRLTLNLAEVREERLGDITEAGVIAEGVEAFRPEEMLNKNKIIYGPRKGKVDEYPNCAGIEFYNARTSYISLWNSIDKNDWMKDQDKTVWVYRWDSFEEIKNEV